MLKISFSVLSVVAVLGLVSCGPSVEMPKGTSKGYSSVRLTVRDPGATPIADSTEKQIHGMIQKSIAKQFSSRGLSYGKGGADLVVAYMVIYQEPGMTVQHDQYFGYGRNADAISDLAHTRGVLKNQRPDFFRQAGIIIDVVDSRTNKLVYRNVAKGDVRKGASASTRSARIDAAVGQALASFFGKS